MKNNETDELRYQAVKLYLRIKSIFIENVICFHKINIL